VKLAKVTRAILVGGGGNLAYRGPTDAAPVTLTGLVAGQVYPIQAEYIYLTNTTATNLVGLV
jgi:hypothetical protein